MRACRAFTEGAAEALDGGIAARAVGELHAVIHPDYPPIFNCGFVLTGDESLYHLGARRNLAIHDRVYSEVGLGIVDGHLTHFLGRDR